MQNFEGGQRHFAAFCVTWFLLDFLSRFMTYMVACECSITAARSKENTSTVWVELVSVTSADMQPSEVHNKFKLIFVPSHIKFKFSVIKLRK